MRLGIALLAGCICGVPIAASAQTPSPAEALLRTRFALSAGTVLVGEALRLRVIAAAAERGHLNDDDSSLRMRLGGSMVDYYPLGGDGFRLSMGLRLFPRHNLVRETERQSGRRLLPPRGFPGFGTGIRRYTPAAMVGYNLALGSDANLGFEGGAVVGRLGAVAPGLDRRGNLGDLPLIPRSGINPVVRTALAMRF